MLLSVHVLPTQPHSPRFASPSRPVQVHEHCSTDELLNVTFLKKPAEERARVKVEVPLQFIGEDACPGIRKGELGPQLDTGNYAQV